MFGGNQLHLCKSFLTCMPHAQHISLTPFNSQQNMAVGTTCVFATRVEFSELTFNGLLLTSCKFQKITLNISQFNSNEHLTSIPGV